MKYRPGYKVRGQIDIAPVGPRSKMEPWRSRREEARLYLSLRRSHGAGSTSARLSLRRLIGLCDSCSDARLIIRIEAERMAWNRRGQEPIEETFA